MARERCSATIITFNEESNLRACLESVRWADEVVVVDSGSSDGTVSIAREFTDKVFQNPWPGMREQKNFAADHAASPWIFNLDADERVSVEGRDLILSALEQPNHAGYSFPRKNYFLGKWMRYGGWYPDEVLRLYRKADGEFGGINPHCNVVMKRGTAGAISIPLTHYTYTSFAQYMAKQYPYIEAAARETWEKGNVRSVSAARIFSKTTWKFIETFILKRGFMDGPHGLIAAFGSTFAAYMKQARLWELSRKESKSSKDRSQV